MSNKRMEAFNKAHGKILAKPPTLAKGQLYPSWYRAPNGKDYFGLGFPREIGNTHDGSVYTKVGPHAERPETLSGFFDPFTDEDMPSDQYPLSRLQVWEQRRALYSHRDEEHIKGRPEGLQCGDVAYGTYHSVMRIEHRGWGRIVTTKTWESGKFNGYWVEPVRGGMAMYEDWSRMDMTPENCPRSAYSGSAATQANENPARPRRRFYNVTATGSPALGSEAVGAYLAPDGQWFVGVGKAVAIGIGRERGGISTDLFVFVEPIPGKSGGDYDFFHPITREWMDELPSNPIPGVACSAAQTESLPDRWRALPPITRRPEIGEEYPGRYCPPKAPTRDVYLGVGKVVRSGVTDSGSGSIWVDVEPIPGKSGGDYEFFDPWTGKDMPDDYYPDE